MPFMAGRVADHKIEWHCIAPDNQQENLRGKLQLDRVRFERLNEHVFTINSLDAQRRNRLMSLAVNGAQHGKSTSAG